MALLLVPSMGGARHADPVQATLSSSGGEDARVLAERAGIDLDRVVDEVEHRRAPSPGAPGVPEVDDADYRAVLDADGSELAPAGDPSVSPEQPISPVQGAPLYQVSPDIAFDGTNFLVVWSSEVEYPPGGATIGGVRVSPEGELLDPSGSFLLEPGGVARTDPSVVFADGAYVVAFQTYDPPASTWVSGLRVGADGLLQGEPFRISDGLPRLPGAIHHGEGAPATAFNGESVFVTWQEHQSDAQDVQRWIAGTRLSGTTPVDPSGGVLSPMGEQASRPDISSDGDGFLVVWDVGRSEFDSDVRGARLGPDGGVLDPAGITLAAGTTGEGSPSVTFGDAAYLVVWRDIWLDETGPWEPVVVGAVRAARVDPSGAVLDPTPLELASGLDSYPVAKATFDDANFLVLWRDDDGLNVTRIGQDGAVLDPAGIRLPTSGAFGASAIGAGGGVVLAAWDGTYSVGSDVRGVRLGGDGVLLDPGSRLISAGNPPLSRPAVAFNGTDFLVAWRDNRTTLSQIIGTRVRPDGTVLDPDGFEVSPRYGGPDDPPDWAGRFGEPSVASDGVDFLVVFGGGGPGDEVVAVVVSGQYGGARSPRRFEGILANATPAVAFNGSNYVVATSEPDDDLRALLVHPTGALLTSTDLTDDHRGTYEPVAAGVNGMVLVAWQDGAVLLSDTGVITEVDLPPAMGAGRAAAAADGTGFLLTRMTADGLVATRITADGTVLDPTGIPISGTGGSPSVAFNRSWLVVWNDRRTTGSGPGIYGARIRSDGTVADPDGFLIAAGIDAGTDPAVAATATGIDRWTVAYQQYDAAERSHRMYVRQVSSK